MQLVRGKKEKKMHAFLLMLHGGSSVGDISRKRNMNCCLSVHLRSGELKTEKKRKGEKRSEGRKGKSYEHGELRTMAIIEEGWKNGNPKIQ